MFVKICGTTNLEDARLAVEAGADALGFIFAPSKRRVTVEQAAAIAPHLPGHVLLVGVFTQPNVTEIVAAAYKARLAAVQMHWRYDPQIVQALVEEFENAYELWQVVGFPVDASDQDEAEQKFRDELRAALLDSRLDRVLLDTVKGESSGGLGRTFSWQRAAGIINALLAEAELAQKDRGFKLPAFVLAGGLQAENVQEAIQALRPGGVDVVSGVEASPGRKSPDRLREFVEAARR